MRELSMRIQEADWDRLRKLCASSFRERRDTEFGAIGVLGKRFVKGELREVIVASILWPGPQDVSAKSRSALTFSSSYLRRVHMAVRQNGLLGIVTFHTHPLSDMEVDFSSYDDDQDPLLVENLQELWPGTLLSSVVLGRQSQKGRLWRSATDQVEIKTLVVVGNRLQYLPLDGRPAEPSPTPSEIFDRAQAITGRGALAQFAKRTAAVVGASGTGSLVCELLARAGARRIFLIDPDVVELANLNRILYVTVDDVRRPKAKVLRDRIEGLKIGCEVIPIVGSILDNKVLECLNEADFVFGCVDRDYPRMILCKYAYQHFLPYIDVGAEIGGDQEGIVSTDARTNFVAPGRWCLRCTGLVSARRLAFESLTARERGRKIALGYSDDLLIKQPAVMDLNMRAASAGVMLLRHLFQPFLLEPFPVTLAENFVTYNMKAVASARAKNEGCDICRNNSMAGFGDCGEEVGLLSEIAAALVEPRDKVHFEDAEASQSTLPEY
jgi:hypothetical protein